MELAGAFHNDVWGHQTGLLVGRAVLTRNRLPARLSPLSE